MTRSTRRSIIRSLSSKYKDKQRRKNILARVHYFKEDALIEMIRMFISMYLEKKCYATILKNEIISYIFYTGLYLVYYEIFKFGFPKEKKWIKFRRVINYILLFFSILSLNSESQVKKYDENCNINFKVVQELLDMVNNSLT